MCDQFGGFIELCYPTTEDKNVSAFGNKSLGSCQADTGRSAANNSYFSCKLS